MSAGVELDLGAVLRDRARQVLDHIAAGEIGGLKIGHAMCDDHSQLRIERQRLTEVVAGTRSAEAVAVTPLPPPIDLAAQQLVVAVGCYLGRLPGAKGGGAGERACPRLAVVR